jgi:hypothetical protein
VAGGRVPWDDGRNAAGALRPSSSRFPGGCGARGGGAVSPPVSRQNGREQNATNVMNVHKKCRFFNNRTRERSVRDEGVAGSNPATPTKETPETYAYRTTARTGLALAGQLLGQRRHKNRKAKQVAQYFRCIRTVLMFFVDDTGHERLCCETEAPGSAASAPDYESGGQEFESLRARQTTCCQA